MSALKSNARRNGALASVAVAALMASAAIGSFEISGAAHANAATVTTSDSRSSAMPSFADVVQRVKPAVVSVKVTKMAAAEDAEDMQGESQNVPPQLRQFFDHFGQGGGMTPAPQTLHKMIGLGSGFFVSADGYIVTNNHVVEGAKTVTVTMDDGKTMDAKVVGTDPKTDLAVLKVADKGDYPFVSFAKGSPRVGDWVVAIGNPFGLGGTVTAGIISAEGRDIGRGPYDQYLQIDAPINKGNSGGPTFDMQGNVIGVNTAIYSPTGGSVGVGFDIPAGAVSNVVDALEHGGYVSRGYLGVMMQPVSQDIADGLGLKTASGALIDQAQPGTPAAAAGLKSGDIVTKLNGEAIKDAGDLTRHVGALKPGEKVEISFLRDGVEKTVNVTLGSQKNEQTAMAGDQSNEGALKLGLRLAPASEVAGAGDQGVAIVNVDPDSMAASKGLTDGDVILNVSGKSVSQPGEVKSEIAAAKHDGKKAVLMRIRTAQGERFVAFEFPKA
jgi:serine protease Do